MERYNLMPLFAVILAL